MTHYLCDIENIQHRWGRLVPVAQPGDVISLFYSNKTGSIKLNPLGPACLKGIRMDFVQCDNGKPNALDFQLVSSLGFYASTEPVGTEFIIVTGDNGFMSVIDFWARRGINVRVFDPVDLPDFCEPENPAPPAPGPQFGPPVFQNPLPVVQAERALWVQCPNCHSNMNPDEICHHCGYSFITGVAPGNFNPPPSEAFMNLPPTVEQQEQAPEPEPPSSVTSIRRQYIDMLAEFNLSPDDNRVMAGILIASMRQPQNKRKLDCRNRIRARYGAKRGEALYAAVKNLVHDIARNGPIPPPEAPDGSDNSQESEPEQPAKSNQAPSGPPGRKPSETTIRQALSATGVKLTDGEVKKLVNVTRHAAGSKNPAHILSKQVKEVLHDSRSGRVTKMLKFFVT